MSAPRPRPKRAYHHGNLHRDLIAAAVEIIAKQGAHGLTLQTLAKRLGVTQTAPYRHFASKEALLAAVAAEGFAALLEDVHAEMAAVGADVVARYTAVGSAYVRFALAHPAHFQVMYGDRPSEFNHGVVAEAGRAAFKVFVDTIEACQRAGRASQGDPTWIAVQGWSQVHGLVLLHLRGLLPRKIDAAKLRSLAAQMTIFLHADLPPRPPAQR
jgi:AcrR family transcriptional regulator